MQRYALLILTTIRNRGDAYYSIAFIVSCYLLIIFFAFAAKKVSVSFFNKQL